MDKQKEEIDTDFDLPVDETTAKVVKPRVHDFSNSACVGCEG